MCLYFRRILTHVRIGDKEILCVAEECNSRALEILYRKYNKFCTHSFRLKYGPFSLFSISINSNILCIIQWIQMQPSSAEIRSDKLNGRPAQGARSRLKMFVFKAPCIMMHAALTDTNCNRTVHYCKNAAELMVQCTRSSSEHSLSLSLFFSISPYDDSVYFFD